MSNIIARLRRKNGGSEDLQSVSRTMSAATASTGEQ